MDNKKSLILLITMLTSFGGQASSYSCGDFLDAYDRVADQMLLSSERSHAKRLVTNLLEQREQQFQQQASEKQKEVMDLFIKKNRYLKTTLDVNLSNQCNRQIDEDFLDVAITSDTNFIKPILNHPGFYRCSDINNTVNFEWMSDMAVSLLKFDGPLVKDGRVLIYKKSDEEAGISLDEAKNLTAKNCAKYNNRLPLYLSFREAVFNFLDEKNQNKVRIDNLKNEIYLEQKFIPNRDFYQASSEIARNVEKYSNYELARKFNKMAIALHADIKRDVQFLAENNYKIGSGSFVDLFDENHHMNSMVNMALLFDEMRWQINQLKEKEFGSEFNTAKAAFSTILLSDFTNIKRVYLQRTQSEMFNVRVAAVEKNIIDAGYERHWRTISELAYQISDELGPEAEKSFNDRTDVMEQQVKNQVNQLAQIAESLPTNNGLMNEEGILYSAIRSYYYLEGTSYLLSDIQNSTNNTERTKAKDELSAFINLDVVLIEPFYLNRKQQEDEQALLQLEKEKQQRKTDALVKQLVEDEKTIQGYRGNIPELKKLYQKIKGHVNTDELTNKFADTIGNALAKAEKDIRTVAIKRYLDRLKEVQELFDKEGKIKSVVYLNDFIIKSDKLVRDTESAFQYEFGTGGYDDARSELINFITSIGT